MKTYTHELLCEAPICQDDCQPQYIWYPGESVCGKKPYKHFQKIQFRLNKKALVNPKLKETMFRTIDLKKKKAVGRNSYGVNPNTINRRAKLEV